ncbi:MAG: hypothetical protein AB7O66_12765 [Limisphaerales bacterium]
MEREIEVLALINFVVMGISHIVHRRAWAEFFIWLRGRGHAGVFVHGFLSLGFGSIVVAFHNVWSGLPVVLTAYGWLMIFKSLLCFVTPALALRSLQRVSVERSWEFIPAGILFLALAGVIAVALWSGIRTA